MTRGVARDISYAGSATTRSGRAVIRTLENATGRLGLIRRAAGYREAVAEGADFWAEMLARYGLGLDVTSGSLSEIPADGPVVVVANHPYGILDGLILGYILSARRQGEFRILAHKVFRKAEDLNRIILPVRFDESREAVAENLETRQIALRYLAEGGAIGVFPGGTVSTSARPFSVPLDPIWRGFTGKMIAKSSAVVVPVFFDGTNSRLFQIASHLHATLRMALLIQEFRRRVDAPVRVAIGAPIRREELAPYLSDQTAMMDFLRARTYALSPNGLAAHGYGFEFEAKHRRGENGGRYL